MKKILRIFLLLLIAFFNMGMIPTKIQFALFDKVFQHNTILKDKETINIMMIYNKNSSELADFENYFNTGRYRLDLINKNDFKDKIDNYDVVFITPELQDIASECILKKKLTISYIPQYAKSGEVAIAIGLINDSPRVFINLNTLEREGHSVSASLLQIAEVYK